MSWFKASFTTGTLLCTLLAYIVGITYSHRRKIRELQKQGVPMPKGWSWIFGHLMVLQKHVDANPPDAAVAFAMRNIAKEFSNTEVFLMDFWPVYPPLLTVFGPEGISQICNKYNLPKPATTARFMMPVAGGPNLVGMNGSEWKYWRSLFNPGFSTGAMLDNVPCIVDSVLVFREKLIENVDNGIFHLDELTTKLTTEVILKVALDHDSNYQRRPNDLVHALSQIVKWHSFWDPRVLMNPLRPFVQSYYSHVANRVIHKELEERFQELKRETSVQDVKGHTKTAKSIVSLALQAYMVDNKDILKQNKLDENFSKYAAWQVRVFVFAGTDATASIMVYIFHVLAKHPEWLKKLRDEHDKVFGTDPARAAERLKKRPSLLNDCRLTIAVIKETLRLYSPAGTLRAGHPGITITDLKGNEHPMDYAGANILHQALHLNPRVWRRAEEFLPERFLVVDPNHELYPDPAAYRPFEQGPRNCIGQTLVWNELRVAVILTCRDLEIRDAYAEFDEMREKAKGPFRKLKESVLGVPNRTLQGDRAYQTDSAGLHPVDGYPCRVKWVGK